MLSEGGLKPPGRCQGLSLHGAPDLPSELQGNPHIFDIIYNIEHLYRRISYDYQQDESLH